MCCFTNPPLDILHDLLSMPFVCRMWYTLRRAYFAWQTRPSGCMCARRALQCIDYDYGCCCIVLWMRSRRCLVLAIGGALSAATWPQALGRLQCRLRPARFGDGSARSPGSGGDHWVWGRVEQWARGPGDQIEGVVLVGCVGGRGSGWGDTTQVSSGLRVLECDGQT